MSFTLRLLYSQLKDDMSPVEREPESVQQSVWIRFSSDKSLLLRPEGLLFQKKIQYDKYNTKKVPGYLHIINLSRAVFIVMFLLPVCRDVASMQIRFRTDLT